MATFYIYKNVVISLYENHKILYPFLLAIKQELEKKTIKLELLEFFCNSKTELMSDIKNPFSSIPKSWWMEICG